MESGEWRVESEEWRVEMNFATSIASLLREGDRLRWRDAARSAELYKWNMTYSTLSALNTPLSQLL